MGSLSLSSNVVSTSLIPPTTLTLHTHLNLIIPTEDGKSQTQKGRALILITRAAKSGGGRGFSLKSIINRCETCGGQGAIECPGCKGTGKNKKNGNIFERWKCYECQGFGLKSCPACGTGGLTPEQRGER